MRLKSITLNNIRSYENEKIEFPEGSTLLSGDIGTGKTSILLAIEFALFGLQPGQRGNSLLRNAENKGGVVIEFYVDDKNVTIERTLKRGKSVSQDYCAITIDNQKSEISVTELKDRVLKLLNYPKEFAKKQNLLYKFTVYTPQEEMKQIILEDSQTRVNTLRHVFGIDKYKTIIENSSILASKLREEKRIKEALTDNLENDRLEIICKCFLDSFFFS
jgi:exonuclease SbcC